ncbi:MAG: 50S ribosomal protein L23 [Candidatus Pacearchaeota archaeon]
MILIEPVTTEKALRMIELENKIVFVVKRDAKKQEIKKEVEEIFNVKVEKVNVHIKKNKKIAFIKLKKETPAIDVATKLGIM